ncbi:MAG TPA: cation:proton antiporter [Candidatus Competibacteraceae bacterium]|jgi:multicomponent Na+:H+ antiporter subunit F|nr:cation:proton antiporter [Candidatus Competibacteraceae bacterium]HRZ06633.1 cation:proton antiporter [Candidatus Competibacteraceae bacterium]HSA47313.1 cation:proton antiporter [Candidatus Competibacteraceae bacterium]
MFAAAALGILICMVLAMARALLGPTVYDRIMAVNAFGTKTVLIIAVLGFMSGRPDFMDIALVYALINFIGTIAVLKFIRYGDMGWPRNAPDEPDDL